MDQRLPKRDLSLVLNLDCSVHRKRFEHFTVERLEWSKLLVPRFWTFQPGTRRAKKRGPIVGARLAIFPCVNTGFPKQRLRWHSMPHLGYATVRIFQCGQPSSAHICKGLIYQFIGKQSDPTGRFEYAPQFGTGFGLEPVKGIPDDDEIETAFIQGRLLGRTSTDFDCGPAGQSI